MESLFTGLFRRSIDGKNRVLVPSEVREGLEGDDRRGLFFVPSDECVSLWPRSYLLRYAQEQGTDPFGNQDFNRSFFSQSIFRSFDGTGRIVLPPSLVPRFPERELMFVGAGLYLEAWSPAVWETRPGTG